MRSLLRFLVRYHTIILFLFLEIVAFILIAQFSSYQRSKIYKFKHYILGGIERRFDNLSVYLHLVKENKELSEENARLYNMLPMAYYNPISELYTDSIGEKQYEFMGARVINNSTNKQYNFLIIDKGTKHGVEPDMGVICKDGIVGLVKECSPNFSSVISILNREFSVVAMIKRNGYYGPIEWPGRHYNKVELKEIPTHVDIRVGDTIVTHSESGIFPPGLLIGTIEDFEIEEGIFYNIKVDLSADLKKVSNVTLVKYLKREELVELEESLEND